jgi:RNA-directed DNA polymerase
MSNGNQNNNNKNNDNRVRAVRRLTVQDLTIEEIFYAYFDCRQNKRYKRSALAFEEQLESNIVQLYDELTNNEYTISHSTCFVVEYPKTREVWAAGFRDRIVHHLIYNRYSKIFCNKFIHDSYACIPGKGTLAAANRLVHFTKSITNNYQKEAYFLKIDIKNYFMSIDHEILDTLVSKTIKDEYWMNLTRKIIHHDVKPNAQINCTKQLLAQVPKHKSMFNTPNTRGLPIGNLSSQLFANIYLNELDQYCKHKLKTKYYIRYVDDIVILSEDVNQLKQWYVEIQEFAKTSLKLEFHPNKTQINTVHNGINFVGYIINPYRKYVRRSTIDNMYKKVKTTTNLRSTVNSYLGMMKHTNNYNEKLKLQKSLLHVNFSTNLHKVESIA